VREVKTLHCRKCHRLVTCYTQTIEGTQLIIDGKPFGARAGGINYVIDGKRQTGIPVGCQSCGEINVIRDTPEMQAEAERQKYNHGKECTTHYRALQGIKVKCTVRMPCTQCVAYQD